jgi:competence transcription factor ComK
MNYITNNAYGCCLFQNNSIIKLNMSSITYIKHLCYEHLFTYQGYIKACKKKFGLKYKIPLYLSDMIQLFSTKNMRDIDTIWINYAQIRDYKPTDEGVCVYFYDGSSLNVKISYKSLNQQIIRLNTIRDVKVKHFHN